MCIPTWPWVYNLSISHTAKNKSHFGVNAICKFRTKIHRKWPTISINTKYFDRVQWCNKKQTEWITVKARSHWCCVLVIVISCPVCLQVNSIQAFCNRLTLSSARLIYSLNKSTPTIIIDMVIIYNEYTLYMYFYRWTRQDKTYRYTTDNNLK